MTCDAPSPPLSLDLSEAQAETMARAIYACNPLCDQNTDLDGRPAGKVFEVSFDSLYDYDAGLYANMMDAARAAYVASPAALLAERVRVLEEALRELLGHCEIAAIMPEATGKAYVMAMDAEPLEKARAALFRVTQNPS